MGPLTVVKVDIGLHPRSEFFFRAIFISVEFFPFHGREERLHYGIVIGNACRGKGLGYIPFLQISAESAGPIVAPLIRVKDQAITNSSGLVSIPKSLFHQLRTVILTNPALNDFPCKQIHDHADEKPFVFQIKTGNITDLDLIWLVHIGGSIDNVPHFSRILCILFFCSLPNAFQPHFTHQSPYILFGSFYSFTFQSCGNLWRPIYLVAVFVHLPDADTQILLPLLIAAVSSFIPENMVIEGSPENIQRFADHSDAVFVFMIKPF